LARSADRLRAGEGAPQSGLVTGSATALEKEKRAKEYKRSHGREGKGRKKGGRVWRIDMQQQHGHCQKTGDQNKGPTAKLAPGLRCPHPSQGMRSDRQPDTRYPYGLICPAPVACRSSRVHWQLPVTHVHFVKKPI
jgi:hypothetical protein